MPSRRQDARASSRHSADTTRIPSARSARFTSTARESRVGASPDSARPEGRGSGSSLTSVRIGDIERLERAERSRQAKGRRRAPLVVAVVAATLALVCVIAYAVAVHVSAFAIEDLEVVGYEHLTTAEVSELVSVPQGTTLLDVDVDGIKSSLLRDAWVESVTVKRIFPSTLRIVITEREIAAVVEVTVGSSQTIQNWAIASDGMWLMAIPDEDSELGQSLSPQIYEDAAEVLWITDVPYGVTPEIGAYCTDDNVNNALAIVAGMTTELADQVKIVSATDAESTMLTLESGIEIAFGEAEDIREKERVCLQIMEEYPSAVYINVRIVDSPTWRAA